MYFNYFFPGRRGIKLDDLVQAGLGYVFAPEVGSAPGTPFVACQVMNGPGGQHGLVVSPADEFIGYYEDKQSWKQEVGKDYWVGFWRDKRPTPTTLARATQIAGETILLDDGQPWTFPIVRHWEEFDGEITNTIQLPHRMTRNEAGEWIPGKIKERYRKLWHLLAGYLEAVVSDADLYEEYNALIVEAFQCNYKVSDIEIDLLGLYDLSVRDTITQILLDHKSYAELIKKKQAPHGTGDSSSGQSE